MSSQSSLPKRRLPAKEAAAFKSLLVLFENKLYKKALKQADQILRINPEHGGMLGSLIMVIETLAIKGLVLAHLAMASASNTSDVGQDACLGKNAIVPMGGERGDPLELIKTGIRLDTNSFICWQVLGLYHRLKRNFAEALRCYKAALRLEPYQQAILKDSALLQAHERQFSALVESRTMLLKASADEGAACTTGPMWRALSVAYAMANQPGAALRALEASLSMEQEQQQQDAGRVAGMQSELMRFKWKLEMLAGHSTTTAVSQNAPIADLDVRDKAIEEFNGLNVTIRAEARSRRLLRNPDLPPLTPNLAQELSAPPEEEDHTLIISDVLSLGRQLEHAASRGDCERFRLSLISLLNENDLLERAPISLFKLVAIAVFEDRTSFLNVEMVRQMILDLLSHERQNSLAGIIFLALFLNAIGQGNEALRLISEPLSVYDIKGIIRGDEAVFSQYTHGGDSQSDDSASHMRDFPLLVDALTVRSKIYKVFFFCLSHRCHQDLGFYRAAADDAIAASKLVPGDRSLNGLAIRRLLRGDEMLEAERDHLSIFFKRPSEETREFQLAWYLVRVGEAHWRLGHVDEAIEAWAFIAFTLLGTSLADDVFDFHGYAFRRLALVGYMELLEATPPTKAPTLHRHPIWQRAACNLLHAAIALASSSSSPLSFGMKGVPAESNLNATSTEAAPPGAISVASSASIAEMGAKVAKELAIHLENEVSSSSSSCSLISRKLALRRRMLLWLHEGVGHRILPFLRAEQLPQRLSIRVAPLLAELEHHGYDGPGLLSYLFALV